MVVEWIIGSRYTWSRNITEIYANEMKLMEDKKAKICTMSLYRVISSVNRITTSIKDLIWTVV